MEVQGYYHRILPFYDAELRDRGDEDFWVDRNRAFRVRTWDRGSSPRLIAEMRKPG